jgi:hypothetical protein
VGVCVWGWGCVWVGGRGVGGCVCVCTLGTNVHKLFVMEKLSITVRSVLFVLERRLLGI